MRRANPDILSDFLVNESDQVQLLGGLTFDQLTITQGMDSSADDALVRVTDSTEVLAILNGVQATSLTSSSFITVQLPEP